MKNRFKYIIKNLWPYLISIILLIVIFNFIGNIDLYLLKEISLVLILISFSFYFIVKIINTLRFSYVYKELNFKELLPSLLTSNFLLSLFPFRAGELSYLVYLKRVFHNDNLSNIKNLLLVRFADLISILIIFVISALLIYRDINNNLSIMLIVYLSYLLIFLIILIFIFKRKISKVFITIIKRNKFNSSIIRKICDNLINLSVSFSKESYSRLFVIIMISLIYWIIRYIFGYVVLSILGIKLTFFTILFITSITMFIGLIPIQTFAGFGIHEISWTYLLVLFGVPSVTALTTSLVFHLIILIPVFILGIISWIYLIFRHNNKL